MWLLPSERDTTQTSTSGGSSETDENAFAVMPYACCSPRVVITVTPVAKLPTVSGSPCCRSPHGRDPLGAGERVEATADDLVEVDREAE